MGLDKNGTRFLLYAKFLGADFSKTAIIGRQGLHLSPSDLRENLRTFRYQLDEKAVNSFFLNSNGYAEDFIRHLGASVVHSFDYSDYEGATHIHDMNVAIPNEFKNKYTVVLDGGSLEHVFNFPVAIKNCMEMVEAGGHYLGITPANNFMGHGYYQFSPELFFRVFTEENGYRTIRVMAFEDLPDAQWFSVKDPKTVMQRVTLVNRTPVYLLIIAKRINTVTVFETMPQQSDYVLTWAKPRVDNRATPFHDKKDTFISSLKKRVPMPIKLRIKKLIATVKQLIAIPKPTFDPRFFEPINLSEELLSPDKALQRTS